jgi:hypothetical protein
MIRESFFVNRRRLKIPYRFTNNVVTITDL